MNELMDLMIDGSNVLFICDKGSENEYSKEIEKCFMSKFDVLDAKSIIQIRKVLKSRFVIMTIESGINGKVNDFIKALRSTCQLRKIRFLQFRSENIKVGLDKNDVSQLTYGLKVLEGSMGAKVVKLK